MSIYLGKNPRLTSNAWHPKINITIDVNPLPIIPYRLVYCTNNSLSKSSPIRRHHEPMNGCYVYADGGYNNNENEKST